MGGNLKMERKFLFYNDKTHYFMTVDNLNNFLLDFFSSIGIVKSAIFSIKFMTSFSDYV